MKKYLVWKVGAEPSSGVVIAAESSLLARKEAARQYNRKWNPLPIAALGHLDFCTVVWAQPEVPATTTSRLTQEDADRIETLAKVYAKAAAEKSWAGAQHPEDAVNIRQNYVNASRALTAALRELVR